MIDHNSPEKKTVDGILDIEGLRTDAPLTKRVLLSFILAAATYSLCMLLPIDCYGAGTARALGMLYFGVIVLQYRRCFVQLGVSCSAIGNGKMLQPHLALPLCTL